MPLSILDLSDVGLSEAQAITANALHGAEDGELFVERRATESFSFDDGKLKAASFDEHQGFGLRAVTGETAAYAHSSEISKSALQRAAALCQSMAGRGGTMAAPPPRSNAAHYGAHNPVAAQAFPEKIALLQAVDAFARALGPEVTQVSVSLASDWQEIEILRADGAHYRDIRPLSRFGVSVTSTRGGLQGQGSHGLGGRGDPLHYVTPEMWQAAAREAYRQSLVALDAVAAPAGEIDVLLGPGWPGILLHEAIGHGLEGDFNRKGTSAFAGLMGQRIAAQGVTVVDDGTLPKRRGSLTIDDEGTPSQRTVLIEDGILVGYMQDRLNGRLMGTGSTGNGRRQSYSHAPLPRMTNTYMLAGQHHPDEILKSIKKGMFAKSFGGGQVDITSGKFVFSCTEAYLIEDGKITAPVKGATIIGSGADALTRISMVGHDMDLDPGIGTCGKQGQGVPVGVGQPTLRINGLTVGGTQA